MTASLIVAAAANEVIGLAGALPWHLPGDMRRFRALTTGRVVVMGRVTHESILDRLGHPLANRTSIVVSRTLRGSEDDRVLLVPSVEPALSAAASIGALAGSDEFFIIGGESVYRQALPAVDRVYLTRVHEAVAGDRRMPADWLAGFELTSRQDAADPESQIRYSFLGYRRVPS